MGWLDLVAIGLVVVGSYLNAAAELQRKWWKANPKNKGKCYTEGLFAYSMHVNDFGDSRFMSSRATRCRGLSGTNTGTRQ